MALQSILDKESNKKISLTPMGIFIEDGEHNNQLPEKIMEVKENNLCIMNNQEYKDLVGIGGSSLFKVHTLALKMILKYTNKKHIYVTLPTGVMKKVAISKLLNNHMLIYFKTSGIDKFAYCDYNDI